MLENKCLLRFLKSRKQNPIAAYVHPKDSNGIISSDKILSSRLIGVWDRQGSHLQFLRLKLQNR